MPYRIHELEPDILIFTGEALGSNSTIFVDGSKALVVDALADKDDAALLEQALHERGLSVVFFVITHYFSDHLAALSRFPDATIVAHTGYLNTFYGEDYRSEEEAARFVVPDMLIDKRMIMRWGRHTLDIFHAPGHTASTLNIDIPTADVLICSDNAVGNIAYIYYSHPHVIRTQLSGLAERGRQWLIQGHGGVQTRASLLNAIHYLDSLTARFSTPASGPSHETVAIEEFLAPGLRPNDFEKFFHERNINTLKSRRPFDYMKGGNTPI